MYYDILDKKRIEILPRLKEFKKEFYLAGGTALALQIGHRDSVDFDFFKPENTDTKKLFKRLQKIFSDYPVLKIQEEDNTLSVLIAESIKLSFFTYEYDLLKKTINEEFLDLASVEDIACMKLSAILSRATNKDYIDLYYIFKEHDFEEIMNLVRQKFKDIDLNLILKSLVYFADLEYEPIKFKHGHDIEFNEVERFLIELVKKRKF